jgi:hypothetical protein
MLEANLLIKKKFQHTKSMFSLCYFSSSNEKL